MPWRATSESGCGRARGAPRGARDRGARALADRAAHLPMRSGRRSGINGRSSMSRWPAARSRRRSRSRWSSWWCRSTASCARACRCPPAPQRSSAVEAALADPHRAALRRRQRRSQGDPRARQAASIWWYERHRASALTAAAAAIAAACWLGGCGFHLQGSRPLPQTLTVVRIEAVDTQSDFYFGLRKALLASGTRIDDAPRVVRPRSFTCSTTPPR